jgi:peptide/nickel transport system ATP-binding protein
MTMVLVEIEDLQVRFTTRRRVVQAVEGVSLRLEQGEVLGLLGESGSGKSVTMRSIMGLLPQRGVEISGAVRACGVDVLNADEETLRQLRGPKVAMIFQEPMTALDPVFPIGHQIAEPIVYHEGLSWSAALRRAKDLLELVQVPSPERRLQAYPHELSGGLRQRAMIAVALACNPAALLADEPTTALDATVQIQILLLLRSLQKELGMAAIMVTHDVGVAAEISDRIAVMHRGKIVETGSAVEVLKNPQHPYTRALLQATIRGDVDQNLAAETENVPLSH